jgi:hypothetical protein
MLEGPMVRGENACTSAPRTPMLHYAILIPRNPRNGDAPESEENRWFGWNGIGIAVSI